MENSISRLVTRVDGWFNVLTGLGRKDRDKRMSAAIEWVPLQEKEVEYLYAGDDMAAKIVDLLPNEAMRGGFKIIGYETEANDALDTACAEIGLKQNSLQSWIWARIYGGSGMLLITDDLTKLAEPLPQNAVVRGLRPIQRWELVPEYESVEKDIRSPNFGMPTFYQFYPRMVNGKVIGERIHFTRLVRFDGEELPGSLKRENNYWGDSVLSKLQNAIRNYQTEHDSAASIVQDFRIGKFKIKGLADMLAADKDQDIIKRLELVRLSKSVASAIVLDADSEEFDYSTSTVTGIPELLGKAELRLVSGSGIPHTVLLGESPVGSNATGNSTVLSWYDTVEQERQNYLKPRLLAVVRLKAKEMGLDPKLADIDFKPLWQMDEAEQANIRKTQADTDAVYLDRGVVDAAEIAVSRFGGDKYSTDTKLERSEPAQLTPETTPPQPVPAPAQPPGRTDNDGTGVGLSVGTIGAGTFGATGEKTEAVLKVISEYHAGAIPKESAIFLIQKAMNLSIEEVEKALGEKKGEPAAPVATEVQP